MLKYFLAFAFCYSQQYVTWQHRGRLNILMQEKSHSTRFYLTKRSAMDTTG